MRQVSDEPDWTEPGAHPVSPGVHRIPLPLPSDGLRAVNVYAIETDRGLTCVDGGWALEVSRRQLESSLRSIGYAVSDITRFLVTHMHRDHYTQAAVIRRELGTAEVWLGSGEQETFALIHSRDPEAENVLFFDWLHLGGAHGIAQRWKDAFGEAFGGKAPDLSQWGLPDVWLEGEQPVRLEGRRLIAVPTPGHTQGHFVFTDESARLLFAGDHVLPTITPSIGVEAVSGPLPLGDFLGSLERVRALPDLALLPAHGPVTASSHTRVDELLVHHAHRLELCRRSLESGARTAYEVAGDLPWTRRERAFADLDVFNAALAVHETMLHLDLLVARGQAAFEDVEGVRSFSLSPGGPGYPGARNDRGAPPGAESAGTAADPRT
jgi:glyoxylase-like metal-dependent hydrolase (beta-lactamase superfamily II)